MSKYIRPGWESHAITLGRPCIHCNKNINVVCYMPKILSSVSFIYLCKKKYRRCYDFEYQFFDANFFKPVLKTIVCDFT